MRAERYPSKKLNFQHLFAPCLRKSSEAGFFAEPKNESMQRSDLRTRSETKWFVSTAGTATI
jgi:hypothetical protein